MLIIIRNIVPLTSCNMKVLQYDNFAVYIYSDHAPPHCHVRFSDGDELIIALPSFKTLAGGKNLKRNIKELLMENLDFLCTKWDELN